MSGMSKRGQAGIGDSGHAANTVVTQAGGPYRKTMAPDADLYFDEMALNKYCWAEVCELCRADSFVEIIFATAGASNVTH